MHGARPVHLAAGTLGATVVVAATLAGVISCSSQNHQATLRHYPTTGSIEFGLVPGSWPRWTVTLRRNGGVDVARYLAGFNGPVAEHVVTSPCLTRTRATIRGLFALARVEGFFSLPSRILRPSSMGHAYLLRFGHKAVIVGDVARHTAPRSLYAVLLAASGVPIGGYDVGWPDNVGPWTNVASGLFHRRARALCS